MLVHVVELKGSGPREVGAQMLVTDNAIVGTIGGGELERTAMLKARDLLQTGKTSLVRMSLGPELSQCCGGAVTLAFEPFASADLAWVQKLMWAAAEPAPVVRTVRLGAQGRLQREWRAVDAGAHQAIVVTQDEAGFLIRERVNPPLQALWVFGAGHVGRAVVRALEPLGFAINWIDGRQDYLPEPPLPGVRQLALAMPELAVEEAPPGSIFLVMTHSHPLDQAICEAVLRRGDFAYLGLIGSDTKRARFSKRLGEAGIPSSQLDRLTCPIGLPGIKSKEPAAIAASVAADLLMRREKASGCPASVARNGS
jgi:xanthine dehydrogenase accessory factor